MDDDRNETARQWADKGNSLYRSGAYSEARDAFNRAIDMAPQLGRAYLGRGVCNYSLGNYARAGRDLDAAALLGCEVAGLWSKFEGGDPEVPNEDADD